MRVFVLFLPGVDYRADILPKAPGLFSLAVIMFVSAPLGNVPGTTRAPEGQPWPAVAGAGKPAQRPPMRTVLPSKVGTETTKLSVG